jgi:hypothetical protein
VPEGRAWNTSPVPEEGKDNKPNVGVATQGGSSSNNNNNKAGGNN